MLLPLAGCGVGAPARPGPHEVGAVGPSAPPARSAALRPASPARPRLRRRPCRSALPAHSPPGVAGPRPSPLPAAKPGRGLRPAALPLRGPAICTAARNGGASAAFPALRARRGAGERRLRAGVPAVAPAGKAKASPAQGGKPPTSGGLACQCPGQRGPTVAGVPPCAGLPPLLILVTGGAFYVCCSFSVLWCVCPSVAGSVSLPGCLPVCLVALPGPALPVALCGGGFGGGPVGLGLPVLLCVRCRRSPRGRCPVWVAAPALPPSQAARPGSAAKGKPSPGINQNREGLFSSAGDKAARLASINRCRPKNSARE